VFFSRPRPIFLARLSIPAALVCVAILPMTAIAGETLRMAVGTLSYPLETTGASGRITGGLLKDMGDGLAAELGATIEYVSQSRRRIDANLLSGALDIACYSHPDWWDGPKPALWTIPTVPQIERIVRLKSDQVMPTVPVGLEGKRVAVHTGYHFPAIQHLFDSGKAMRLDESQVPLLFKALETGLADVLITSEAEIRGYLDENPEKRALFDVSREPFSIVPTQCAVSPKSRWSLAAINKALAAMLARGDFDRMTARYGMAMR